jgi:hypothetical protein
VLKCLCGCVLTPTDHSDLPGTLHKYPLDRSEDRNDRQDGDMSHAIPLKPTQVGQWSHIIANYTHATTLNTTA